MRPLLEDEVVVFVLSNSLSSSINVSVIMPAKTSISMTIQKKKGETISGDKSEAPSKVGKIILHRGENPIHRGKK